MNSSVNGTQVALVLIVKRQHHSHGHCTAKDNLFVTSSDLPEDRMLSNLECCTSHVSLLMLNVVEYNVVEYIFICNVLNGGQLWL